MKVFVSLGLLILLNSKLYAGGGMPLKEGEIEKVTQNSTHVFDAEFIELKETFLYKGKELKGEDLKEFIKIKNSKSPIHRDYGEDGKVISSDARQNQSSDPFGGNPSYPKILKSTIAVKGGKEFEFFELQVKETVTFLVKSAIKGEYKINEQYSFDFYRHSLLVGCPHIAQLGEYKKPQRYFLTERTEDPDHEFDFKFYTLTETKTL